MEKGTIRLNRFIGVSDYETVNAEGNRADTVSSGLSPPGNNYLDSGTIIADFSFAFGKQTNQELGEGLPLNSDLSVDAVLIP